MKIDIECDIVLLKTNSPSRIHKNKVKTKDGYTYVLSFHESPTICKNDGLLSGNYNLHVFSKEVEAQYLEPCIDIDPFGNVLTTNIAYDKSKRPCQQLKLLATTDEGIETVDRIPNAVISAYIHKAPFDKVLVTALTTITTIKIVD